MLQSSYPALSCYLRYVIDEKLELIDKQVLAIGDTSQKVERGLTLLSKITIDYPP